MQNFALEYTGTPFLCYTTVGVAVLLYLNKDLFKMPQVLENGHAPSEISTPSILSEDDEEAPLLAVICVEEPMSPGTTSESSEDEWTLLSG